MKITPVTSAQNALLKQIRSLHQRSAREKEGRFLIEGPRLLNEAFSKGVAIQDVVASNDYWEQGMPNLEQAHLENLSVADDKVFKDLVTTQSSCGIVAIGATRDHELEDCLKGAQTLIVIGESLQDPGNAGTLIRSALAFGATGVVLTKGSVDPYNPKVVRSAMGALFTLPVVTEIALETLVAKLARQQIHTIALAPTAGKELKDAQLIGPVAIMLGNEGNGLSQDALNLAEELVKIPMADATESLNVAICGAIVLYQCAQRRGLSAEGII